MATEQEKKNSAEILKNVKEVEKTLQRINVESAQNANTFKDISVQLKANQKINVDTASAISNINSFQNSLKNTAKELSQFDKEALKDKKRTQDLLNKETAAKKAIVGLEAQIKVLENARAGETAAVQKQINEQLEKLKDSVDTAKQLVGNFDTIRNLNEDLNKKTAFFDKLDDLFGQLPVVGPAFSSFAKSSKEIRDNFGDGGFIEGLKTFLDIGAKGAILFGGTQFIKGVGKQDKQLTSLARNLTQGFQDARGEAVNFRDGLVDVADKAGKPVSFLIEGIEAVNEELGTQGLISMDAAKQFSTLTHRLKLSTEEATNLFKASAAIGEEFSDVNDTLVGQTMALNSANGLAIDYKDIMQDVGSFSSAVLLTQNKFAGGLGKAAFTARKLGLEMSDLENIAGNLLDFENSIAAELEAELITGKQLNLENARMAALKGDMAALGEELAAQDITASKFGSMNVLAQESIAKAMGMSREQMSKMLVEQEALKKVSDELGIQGLENLDTEGRIEKIMNEQKVSRSEALSLLGKEELAQQQKNVELQTKAAENMLALQENIKGDFVAPLKSMMETMAANMKTMQSLMYGLSIAGMAYYAGSGLMNMIGGPGKMGKVLRNPKLGARFLRRKGGKMLGGVKSFAKGGLTMLGGASLMSMASPGKQPGISDATPPKNVKSSADISKTVKKKAESRAAKQAAKSGAKVAGKKGVGMMLKKVPILGAIVGAGYAVSRAAQGDWLGAAGELASGIASTVPGAGTAISLGIDGALIARDMGAFGDSPGSRAGGTAADSTMSSVASATDNALKYQTKLVELMETSNELNKKMLAKNSDVNIDGQKASSILYQGTFKYA